MAAPSAVRRHPASKTTRHTTSSAVRAFGTSDDSDKTITRPTSGTTTVTLSVSVQRIGSYDKNVDLTATGAPTGVTVSFSPGSGTPSFGSTMTVAVDSSAALGKTTITIKATGADAVQQTATFELTVG